MKSKSDVTVVLVGLNARNYIRQALLSLRHADWRACTYQIVYVDNGSRDNSVVTVRTEFPEVRIIVNPTNIGFCRAANQGAKSVESRYYFFLNDDTLVLKDAVAILVDFMDHNSHVAVVGSRLLNPDFSDQWSGRLFPSSLNAILGRRSVLSRWFPRAKALAGYLCQDQVRKGIPFPVDWVSAAALLVEESAFHKVGGFAEDYYYWHEPVFCDRIRATGKQVYLHPQSQIVHYEGKGSGQRPYSVRKRHIIDFHLGAYRCYCEHFRLHRYHPIRALVGAGLLFRAAALLAWNRFGET